MDVSSVLIYEEVVSEASSVEVRSMVSNGSVLVSISVDERNDEVSRSTSVAVVDSNRRLITRDQFEKEVLPMVRVSVLESEVSVGATVLLSETVV